LPDAYFTSLAVTGDVPMVFSNEDVKSRDGPKTQTGIETDPRGQTDDNGVAQSFNHDEYNGPDTSTTLTRVRMAGGYQHVYDETHTAGAGDSYEWDISSL